MRIAEASAALPRSILTRVLGVVALALVAAGVVGAARPRTPARALSRRATASVLLVTLDTTRADRLGCYGGPAGNTPNIDRLASSSVVFTRALAVAPITLPAHTSILTGRYPNRHGVTDNLSYRFDGRGPLLTRALAIAGAGTAAFVSAAVLSQDFGLDAAFDRYDDALTMRTGAPEAGLVSERRAGETVDRALQWLAARKEGAPPFFLWVHLYDPHFPYAPPPPFASRFKERPYDGEIAYTDAELGRLLAGARRHAGSTPLVVAVVGDHGESLGEHDERTHGVFLYQSTIHVPMLLAIPGVAPARIDWPVSQVDLAPTLAAAAGTRLGGTASGAAASIDGIDLLPFLRRGAAPPPRTLFAESRLAFHSYRWAELFAAVRWPAKLVLAPEPELYDLARDAGETANVLAQRRQEARPLATDARAYREASVASAAAPALSAEQQARLRSLGYTGGRTASAVSGGPALPDPKRMTGVLADLEAAQSLLQAGDARGALPRLARVLAASPRSWPALHMESEAHLALGDRRAAVAALTRALAVNPSDGLFYNRGSARRGLGQTTEAEQDFRAALAVNPRFTSAYEALATMSVERGDSAAADRWLAAAGKAKVNSASLETTRGALAAAARDYRAAEAAFGRAVALDPGAREAWMNLGQLLLETGRAVPAAEAYARALALGRDVATLLTTAAVHEEAGKRAEALALYREALPLARDAAERAQIRAVIAELE